MTIKLGDKNISVGEELEAEIWSEELNDYVFVVATLKDYGTYQIDTEGDFYMVHEDPIFSEVLYETEEEELEVLENKSLVEKAKEVFNALYWEIVVNQ